MTRTLKRLLFFVSVTWLAIWAYVGWRGYQLTSDAHSYIDRLPAGATVPQSVLGALDAGQFYTLNAVIWGVAFPVGLLIVGWVIKPFLRQRSTSQR